MNSLFQIEGVVEHGRKLGTGLGFPTANLVPDMSVKLPQDGVYLCQIALQDGNSLIALLNQGYHPTLPSGVRTIEIHALDYSGDLYGQKLYVKYLHFLRPERTFDSPEQLCLQVEKDKTDARCWFELHKKEL